MLTVLGVVALTAVASTGMLEFLLLMQKGVTGRNKVTGFRVMIWSTGMVSIFLPVIVAPGLTQRDHIGPLTVGLLVWYTLLLSYLFMRYFKAQAYSDP